MLPFLFIFSASATGPIRINIIDSFFCAKSIAVSSLVRLNQEVLLSKGASDQCAKADFSSARYHGRHVLESFIKEYKGTREIVINPIVVFNDKGEHDLLAWQQAFSSKYQKNSDYNLMAIGIPFNSKEEYLKSGISEKVKFLIPTYVAKKQVGRHVSDKHYVFPSEEGAQNVKVISKKDFPDHLEGHALYGNSLSVVLGLINQLK